MKKSIQVLMSSLSLLMSLSSAASAASNNFSWSFLPGAYKGNYDSQGIPNALDPGNRKTYKGDFWTQLSASLPEKSDIRSTNPGAIASDSSSNLHLVEDGDVYITFLHEGAGYRNSVGFFNYDPANPPKSKQELLEKMVFPNASYANSGGSARGLTSGDTIYLGRFKAGTNIGFVIAANGFDGSSGVKNSIDPNWVFTTLRNLNAESDALLRPHTVMLYDQATQQAVLGLEDMLRTDPGCDHDFNDVIFTLTANPPEAIDQTQLKPLPEAVDTDGDGVLDANDAYPKDPERAFHQYYPEQGKRSTLAFEDNWPVQGDYDMNDLVVRYSFDNVSNSKGEVKDINMAFELSARGAELHNAFAIEIPGISASQIQAIQWVKGSQKMNLQPESQQGNLVLNLVADASNEMPAVTGKCRFANTLSDCPLTTAQNYELHIQLKQTVSKTLIGLPPYNPFIYRADQRGYEIHLPNHAPTAKANILLFGSKDDDSRPDQKQFYKTKANLPWALDIPSEWDYPGEQAEISSAYLDFKPWAESKGQKNSDWYLTNSQKTLIFKK